MRKPKFEEYWIVFLVCALAIFFIIGCAEAEEAETHPLPEDDPITEKLIELNIIDHEFNWIDDQIKGTEEDQ